MPEHNATNSNWCILSVMYQSILIAPILPPPPFRAFEKRIAPPSCGEFDMRSAPYGRACDYRQNVGQRSLNFRAEQQFVLLLFFNAKCLSLTLNLKVKFQCKISTGITRSLQHKHQLFLGFTVMQ